MSTLSFPTRAALIAATIPADVLHVFVSGVGEYRKDNSSANPAATSNSGGTKWIPSGRATVDHFGASGDGTTNDAAAITAADNYVSSIGGGELFFGPKTYGIGTLMTKANMVVWVGPATIKILPTITNASTAIIQNTTSAGLDVRVTKNIGYRNIKFNGNRAAMGHWTTNRPLIQFGKAVGSIVDGCEFVDFKGIAIAEQGSFDTTIRCSTFRNCARTDIEAPVVLTNPWGPDGTNSIKTHVIDNVFQDNQFSAVYLNGNYGQVFSRNWCKDNGESTVFCAENPRQLTISDNYIDGTTYIFSAGQGIEVQFLSGVTITGNIIKNTDNIGLSMANITNGVVSGNHFIDCALGVDKDGIEEHQSTAIQLGTIDNQTCSNISIIGNTFTATSAGQKYCISGNQSGVSLNFANVNITGNIMSNGYASGGYPVRWFNLSRMNDTCRYYDNLDGITSEPVKGHWPKGSSVSLTASPSGYMKSICTTAGFASSATWASGTSYAKDTHIFVPGVQVFRCATAGPGTSVNQPANVFGFQTMADGYVWQNMGSPAVFKTAGAISA